MRKQSEGLAKEYDRLLEMHTKLQVRVPPPAPSVLGAGGAVLLWLQACRPLERGAARCCSPFPPPSLLSRSLEKNLPAVAVWAQQLEPFLGRERCGLAEGGRLLRGPWQWGWPHAQHQGC